MNATTLKFRIRSLTVCAATILVSTGLWAAGGTFDTKPLDLNKVVPAEPARGFIEDIIVKYLPRKLPETKDRDKVGDELKKSVGESVGNDILDTFKSSGGVGKLVTSVKNATEKSFSLTPEASGRRGGGAAVPSLNLQLLAYRAEASLKYSGVFQSALSFVGQDRNLQFVVSKEVCKDTTLSFKQEMPVSEFNPSSRVNLNYNF